MTYREAVEYLDSLINYEKVESFEYIDCIRLDRMKGLLKRLGNPHLGTRAIHIAGSKGKGSTASIVHSILKKAGYKVGLYTSPHLVSCRERIKIGDDLIAEEDIARLAQEVKDAADKVKEEDRPTFFEVYTALAFLYFRQSGVDFGVYEVGLGGRLDATNVVQPLVCGITPISYEHTQKLGNTLREIAREKAGIIKEGSICVTSIQEEEVLDVLERCAAKKGVRLFVVGRDILFEELSFDDTGTLFSVFGRFGEHPHCELKLLGDHQLANAATAIGIIEVLRYFDIFIPSSAIEDGVKDARWEGRLEVIGRSPFLVLDGAQNRASANALARAIKKIFKYDRLFLILGVSEDKDVRGICKELEPITDYIFLTKSKIRQRAQEPQIIRDQIDKSSLKETAIETDGVNEALLLAKSRARRDDLILVTGSLFLVGEARSILIKP